MIEFDYAYQPLSRYTFEYADGNAAASRGTEPDHLCEKVGYLPEDKFAYFAATQINYLPEDFEPEDLIAEAERYFGDLEEFEEMSEDEARAMVERLDITGGDPLMYKITRDGTPIYYDEEMEKYVLDMFAWDDEYWEE